MESFLLQISSRESGSLLQNKTFVPIEGPILSISNSSQYKSISFVRGAWSKSGSKIVASDCYGSIYVFDLKKNRFYLAYRFGTCSSCIVFASESEVLIGLTDCNIAVLNLEKKSVRNKFGFHSSSITCISVDKTGLKVLSASKDEAILWDLSSLNIIRVLTLKQNIDIVKVSFLPDKDIIVSAFKDSSVFLWNSKDFKCIYQFLCNDGENLMNLKTVDFSWDENYIACAGKSDWLIIWNVSEKKRLHTVSLPQNVSVKQVRFLPKLAALSECGINHVLAVLTSESAVYIYSVKNMQLLHSIKSGDNKILSFANSSVNFLLLTVCLQGNLDVYELEPFLMQTEKEKSKESDSAKTDAKKVPYVFAELSKKSIKKKKKSSVQISKETLKSMVKNYEEFPERYRIFIWSQLLELPHNIDAFKVVHQDSLLIKEFVKDYSFMNPSVQKTFLRIMSMLACWFPVLREIEYFQCVVFPFTKVLHKNPIMCFETLVTFISNWCQNWFMFCPFPPFNILCVVENILIHHDTELIAHFIKYKITPEIYAFSLLQTSFSEVFNKQEWFKLWDNIFANSLSFQVYAVAAFNIAIRNLLFQCNSKDQFKQCYRKHGISASVLLKIAYQLQETTPAEISPDAVVGGFAPIPKGTYASFMKISEMKVNFQTHTQKSLLDQEIDYMEHKSAIYEVKGNYLLELQKLQLLRRKLLLEKTDVEDAEALNALARKMKNIQVLIQENLTDQVAMLKGEIGYEFVTGTEDYHLQFFKFKDYLKKLKKDKNKLCT